LFKSRAYYAEKRGFLQSDYGFRNRGFEKTVEAGCAGGLFGNL
jgi:hypothetical protein